MCSSDLREAVTQRFEQALGKRVLIIEPQPDFHIDLGLTFLDDETVAVADPGTTLRRCGDDLAPLAAATRSRGLAERYDAVCADLQRHGLRAVRCQQDKRGSEDRGNSDSVAKVHDRYFFKRLPPVGPSAHGPLFAMMMR